MAVCVLSVYHDATPSRAASGGSRVLQNGHDAPGQSSRRAGAVRTNGPRSTIGCPGSAGHSGTSVITSAMIPMLDGLRRRDGRPSRRRSRIQRAPVERREMAGVRP